ncbi:uncharacterized protein LOC144546607 [Carex rostrata]
MYNNHSLPMVFQLELQLDTIEKGNATCAEYLERIQQIADRLRNAGGVLSDHQLVLYTLRGLGQEFAPFITAFTTQSIPPLTREFYNQKPLTMDEFHRLLLDEEVRLFSLAQPPIVHHAQPSYGISVIILIYFFLFETSYDRDIIRGPDVKWENIKGLENAKFLLKEAIQMPIRYPKYFTGLLSPSKGVLLFGPPGTGKTMLAKAVATECKTTFIDISVSHIVRELRSDPENLVKVVFEVASRIAPCTIFLDEIDSIISQHSETSQRLKTELLIQMDVLAKKNDLVFVLAATNLPWELDTAILRRLEKRILIPLPEPEARCAMFEELLPVTFENHEVSYETLVKKTEGYSGSDIRLVCKEAAMQPLRRLMTVLDANQDQVQEEELPEIGPVKPEDVDFALTCTTPSGNLHAERYQKFNEDYGTKILVH